MKKNLLLAITVCLLFIIKQAAAQNSVPTHIAIIPFTSPIPKNETITHDVQGELASCFIKSRFYLLDRSATDKLKKELDATKDDASLYAKVVAEKGHLANAEYIITG